MKTSAIFGRFCKRSSPPAVDVCHVLAEVVTVQQLLLHPHGGGNPKFCVTAKSGANSVKFIMGGRRVKRLPPC